MRIALSWLGRAAELGLLAEKACLVLDCCTSTCTQLVLAAESRSYGRAALPNSEASRALPGLQSYLLNWYGAGGLGDIQQGEGVQQPS